MSYRPKYDNDNDLPLDTETIKGRILNTTAISNTGNTSTDEEANDASVPTCKVVKAYVDAVKNILMYTSNLDNSSNTFITNGTGGLTKQGSNLKHSNEVTAGTIGNSSATSGNVVQVPYVTYDANGHITGGGTKNHTVTTTSLHTLTISNVSTYDDVELYNLIMSGHSFTGLTQTNIYESINIKAIYHPNTDPNDDDSYYEYVFYGANGTIINSGGIVLYYRD